MHTIIVAPNYIKNLCGVAVVKVSARKMYCCNENLKVLFSCFRTSEDDMTVDFMALVKLIADRAAK